jgi:nucleoid-associated protein YgaU
VVNVSVANANPPPPSNVPGPVVQRDTARYTRGTTVRQPAARYHTVMPGETLQSLARTFYSHDREWVRLFNANRDKIANPNEVPAGTRILIP